jgi:hypothetical protein
MRVTSETKKVKSNFFGYSLNSNKMQLDLVCMSWRSESIWIEFIVGSRKISNFCWAFILFFGSLGFLLVGTSSYLGRNLISLFPSQQIVFFPQGIVMSFYGIAGLFISSYLWCTIFWNVGSGYDRFDRKEGIGDSMYFSLGFSWKKSSHLSTIPYERYSVHQNRS